MLSGIGDSAALTAAGVAPVVNLPSVGQNMSDHVLLPNKFQVTVNDTFNTWEQPANLAPAMAQWEKTHDGPVSDSGFRQLAFLRVPSNNTLFKTQADPSAGPTSAHYEFAFVVSTMLRFKSRSGADTDAQHGTFPSEDADPTKSYVSIVICLLTPTSRGTVGLASKDPFAHPIINPNWLNTDFDKGLMVYALRSALRYAQAPAMQGYLNTTGAFDGATTDAQLINYAAQNSGT
jgi:choline dehydrogenase-like flavoprotein